MRNFFFLTFSTLILLGIWQIVHLRSYFKKSPSLPLPPVMRALTPNVPLAEYLID